GVGFFRQRAKATLAWHVGADAARVAVAATATGTGRWPQAQDALLHEAAHFGQRCPKLKFRRIEVAPHAPRGRLLFTPGGTLVANALRCQRGQRLAFKK